MISKAPGRFCAMVLLLALAVSAAAPVNAHAAEPAVSAEACVLMDADSGSVIYEKNPDSRMLIASTTKIMTALVAIENCSLDDTVEIKREWAATEGSSMGLMPGETCSVRELLYGLLLASGNDAGVAIACHTAGSVEAFAELMNKKAAELGMKDSHFTNPHGLDHAEHYSTARDMAVLAAAAMKDPELALIASTREVRLSPSRYFSNHNKLLWLCEGCIGLKTGYTSKAGRTLVSVCEREGTRLVCVTLRDGNDWDDHARLYDWGFENYETRTVANTADVLYTLPLVSGTTPEVRVRAGADLRLFMRKDAELSFSPSLPQFAYAGLKKGEQIGWLNVYVDGKSAAKLALVCADDAAVDESVPLNFWERVRWAWYLGNQYSAAY